MMETLERVREGEEDPPCRTCSGILKSNTISFGQSLVPEVIDQAIAASSGIGRVSFRGNEPGGLPGGGCGAHGQGRWSARGSS
jgi:NAD-dependent deacetylase